MVIPQLRRARGETARLQLVQALLSRGWAQQQLGRALDVLESLDELIGQVGGRQDLASCDVWALALLGRAWARATLGDRADASASAEKVVSRLGHSEHASLRALAAIALLQAGARSDDDGRYEEALALYARIDRQFGLDPDPGVLRVVADAQFNLGVTLGHLERPWDAIRAYDRVAERVTGQTECEEVVASAHVNKGLELMHVGSLESAVPAFELVVGRWDGASAPGLRAQVAKALTSMGNALLDLGRTTAALAVYQRAIDGHRDEPMAAEDVTTAMENIAMLLCDRGRQVEALAICDEVRKRLAATQFKLAKSHLEVLERLEEMAKA